MKRKSINNQIVAQLEQERLNKMRRDEDKRESGQDKLLIEDFESQLSSNEPIRELLTAKNIKFKTQLTEEQRSAVAVLYHAYRLCCMYGIAFDGLKFVLDEYIDFGVSVDRKGRAEYVDAHKSSQQSQMQNQQMMQQNQMQQMKI
jgi:hypothetical protein